MHANVAFGKSQCNKNYDLILIMRNSIMLHNNFRATVDVNNTQWLLIIPPEVLLLIVEFIQNSSDIGRIFQTAKTIEPNVVEASDTAENFYKHICTRLNWHEYKGKNIATFKFPQKSEGDNVFTWKKWFENCCIAWNWSAASKGTEVSFAALMAVNSVGGTAPLVA